jgi:hypothetical protein
MRDSHAEELSILGLIRASAGYHTAPFADEPARQRCQDRGWIMPEGETGYSLTLDGSCTLRQERAA